MVMPSLLLEWTLSRAETFLNALLVHADNAETLLQPMQQKRIRVIFEPMHIGIDMECKGAHILLSAATSQPAALTLTGSPLQFLHTMTTHSVADLHITGDGKIAQALQRAIGRLNVDVEAFLESIVGGTLAHTLMINAGRARAYSASVATHTLHDMSDYCHYEINAAASKSECDAFAKDVNTLRYAVDHLSAKVNQLKRRIEDSHAE
jgi:ubiquinone biosynthesis protein UbiJ